MHFFTRGIIVAYEEQTERFVVDVSQECFEHQSDPIRSVRAENLELLPAAGATTSSTTAESSRESGDTKPATATTRRASENAAKLRANVAALQKKMTDGMAAKMKKWGEGSTFVFYVVCFCMKNVHVVSIESAFFITNAPPFSQ